ncbi:MAG: hypothetical protein NUV59_02835 [Patescibacteria group bacterium]|nr:hypothetical protein [Patescibacteria group bacterium]
MTMAGNDINLNEELAARFKELPEVVQNAIMSADVQKHLRLLADTHKLHLDQWEKLENEVMLALLGFQPVEDLQKNIEREVKIPADVAAPLAGNISKVVFGPIRGEMERAIREQERGVDEGEQKQAKESGTEPKTPIAPVTPPSAPPEGKAARAPISEAYKQGEASTERRSIDDDPYREPIQ